MLTSPRLGPSLLSVALAALVAGCDGGGSSGGAAASTTAAIATNVIASTTPPVVAPAPRWWSGDFHVHTSHSGDAVDSVRQTRDLARLVGLDFVAMTDHGTLTQTGDRDFVATPDLGLVGGYEWTDLCHMGLIGVRTTKPALHSLSLPPADWPAYVQGLVDDAHAEGGAAILYHPTWNTFPWLFSVQRVDGVEVWNNLWTLSDIGLHPSTLQHVQRRLADKGLAAAGVAASPEILAAVAATGGGNDKAVAYWEALLERGDRVAATGGSDRHKVLPPGYPTTWVFAPTRDATDVIAAVRAGRTIVTRSPAGPRPTLEADGDGDGVFETMIGDSLAAGRPATLRARIAGANGARLRLVRRRRVIAQEAITSNDFVFTLSVTPSPGDWFRVDVEDRVDWNLPAAAPMLAATAGNVPTGGVDALFTAWGVTVATGTTWPAVTLDEPLLRMANATLTDLAWSKVAITSPIYAR